jgi:hypothetical protein
MKSRLLPTALLATSFLLLAACAPMTANSAGESTGGDGETAGGGSGCDGVTSEGYDLFSDPALSLHPEDGFTWGDGTDVAFTYDDYDPDRFPQFGYELGYIQDDKTVSPMGGGFFEKTDEEGNFHSVDNIFDSNAFDRFGFMTVTITQDPTADEGGIDATTTTIGVYCVAFKGE